MSEAESTQFPAINDCEDRTKHREIERKLIEACRQAEEASRAKTLFLANISHEIRTPMNAVIGLTGLMLKRDLAPIELDYTKKIHCASANLLRIIDDILDFSKIETGEFELEKTPFHFDTVLDHIATLLGGKARDKGLELLFDIPPSVPQDLDGDPLRLGQILTNLVDNAIKFTERGHIIVSLRQQASDDKGVLLRFDVRDTGIGMSPEQTAALFKPFSQVDNSATRKSGGTGLGLLICKRLVEMMQGEIVVASAPGCGSTFTFTARFGHGEKTQSPCRPQLATLAGVRVLIADDNPTAREIRTHSLAGLDLRIGYAGSGAEAIEAVRRQDATDPYRIVLMDWKMPGLDGLEASRQIKNDGALRAPPDIIMTTSSGSEGLQQEAKAAGIDLFLTKPISRTRLENALLSLFHPEQDRTPDPTAQEKHYTELQGQHILLVEDDAINRQIARALLESQGLLVDEVTNGQEALKRLAENDVTYGAILMDLQMPEMDGYETASKMRADDRFQALPVIALTAHALPEERRRCLDAGMDDYVTKPIDPDILFSTLLRFCGMQDAEGQTTTPLSNAAEDLNLSAIPGLDAAQGLKRAMGNRELYDKFLDRFFADLPETLPRIKTCLEAKDYRNAGMLVHTLGDTAGNLGAKEVWQAALTFERTLGRPERAVDIACLYEALEHELAYLAWARRTVIGG